LAIGVSSSSKSAARARAAPSGVLGQVGVARGAHQQRQAADHDRPLAQQHAAHVGVLGDRHRRRARVLGAQRPALRALARVGHGLVVGDRRGGDAVDADHDPGLVHHLEHVADALVRLADQPAAAVAALAERQRQAGQALPADLVDHAGHRDVVVDEPVALDAAPRHAEQRHALDAGRRAGDARQGQVHDVVGEIVVAAGDEDLGAAQQVVPVGGRRATVATSARLEPACGSVSAIVPVHSPRYIGGM
jgi:hypothetical protein